MGKSADGDDAIPDTESVRLSVHATHRFYPRNVLSFCKKISKFPTEECALGLRFVHERCVLWDRVKTIAVDSSKLTEQKENFEWLAF